MNLFFNDKHTQALQNPRNQFKHSWCCKHFMLLEMKLKREEDLLKFLIDLYRKLLPLIHQVGIEFDGTLGDLNVLLVPHKIKSLRISKFFRATQVYTNLDVSCVNSVTRSMFTTDTYSSALSSIRVTKRKKSTLYNSWMSHAFLKSIPVDLNFRVFICFWVFFLKELVYANTRQKISHAPSSPQLHFAFAS